MALPNFSKLFERQRKASEDVFATIEDLRRQLVALHDERAAIEDAPQPVAQAEADLDAWLDEIEASAGLPVSGFLRGDRSGWPSLGVVLRPGQKTPDASAAVEQVFALLIATNRDAVRGMMAGAIADALEGKRPLSAEDRAARLREIDAEADRLERAEEALVRAAEAAGLPILRRGDARPEVVLAFDKDLM